MSIADGCIGAATNRSWKPNSSVTSIADQTAPFALGMTLTCTPADGAKLRTLAKFCRVGATSISSTGSAGITSGVTVAAAGGNTYANETGVDLLAGDYAFLTTAPTTA